MLIALTGNPNSGKTSLFNILTGSSQHVGNWPGVTIDKKEGFMRIGDDEIRVVDLPGIYTLDPDSVEQKLARDYIFNEKPDLIVNILDSTNIERSLYLTLQLREFAIPMILVLNMMDEAERAGIRIDMDSLSALLGVPVTGISALKGTGLTELKRLIGEAASKKLEVRPYCSGCSNCTRCKEGEFRYRTIENIVGHTVKKPSKSGKKDIITPFLDKILLNRYLALPIFLLIMLGVFAWTFGSIVTYISGLIDSALAYLSSGLETLLTPSGAPHWSISLLVDGIIPGIGTVLVFLPQITMLFVLMSFLEDSGYMSRAAFIMDRIFSAFGLTGSSFIPLLMGFGCTVPAIMSCRILPTEKDRKMTIMMTSFISCSARLPFYALMTGAFFPKNRAVVIFALYVIGITVAMLSALLLNKTLFKSDKSTFVMEVPPYRMPKMRNLANHTWSKVKGFLWKAGTTLLAASIIIWFLKNFNVRLQITHDPSTGLLAIIGNVIAPIFTPLGFGDWKSATALLTGVAAKEMIVSTFSVLGGSGSITAYLQGLYSPVSAFALMVFGLLYLPCISAIITMKREFNSYRWTVGTLLYSLSVAWIASFAVYNIGKAIFG